jgi:hypothetical protein
MQQGGALISRGGVFFKTGVFARGILFISEEEGRDAVQDYFGRRRNAFCGFLF